jgi:hypothetical protein
MQEHINQGCGVWSLREAVPLIFIAVDNNFVSGLQRWLSQYPCRLDERAAEGFIRIGRTNRIRVSHSRGQKPSLSLCQGDHVNHMGEERATVWQPRHGITLALHCAVDPGRLTGLPRATEAGLSCCITQNPPTCARMHQHHNVKHNAQQGLNRRSSLIKQSRGL